MPSPFAIRCSPSVVELNSMMGGRGFDLFDKRGGLTGFTPIDSFREEGLRRMIYAHRVRRERDGVFGSFDCPDAGQSTARRKDSTTPIQALSLFNSRFTWEQSQALAERIQREVSASPSQDTTPRKEVLQAFWLTLGRPATEHEVAAALPLVQEQGVAMLCRALFNSNEYLYLPYGNHAPSYRPMYARPSPSNRILFKVSR